MASKSITETVIGVGDLTRLRRIVRCTPHARERAAGAVAYWQVWTDTKDYSVGTYLLMYDDGRIDRVTERADEGPDIWHIKPADTEE